MYQFLVLEPVLKARYYQAVSHATQLHYSFCRHTVPNRSFLLMLVRLKSIHVLQVSSPITEQGLIIRPALLHFRITF
jgi:hypothetical protein